MAKEIARREMQLHLTLAELCQRVVPHLVPEEVFLTIHVLDPTTQKRYPLGTLGTTLVFGWTEPETEREVDLEEVGEGEGTNDVRELRPVP